MNSEKETLALSPLGKKTGYVDQYDPTLLFPIPRKGKREEIGISDSALPFEGFDIWTGFELSWLNLKGLPQVAIAEFTVPADSPCLIESKSFKLYLNSFSNSQMSSWEQVRELLVQDLSRAAGKPVQVRLYEVESSEIKLGRFSGDSIDHQDIECSQYTPDPELLTVENQAIEETLHSHLLKSNCLVTGQPDWGSVQIQYRGKKIDRAGLLRYLVSFRNHNEFHEQCVERIFSDILKRCKPEALVVYARYTRRGGLDINPYRSMGYPLAEIQNLRLSRQ